MMLINVSRELAKPLARHLKPARINQPDLLWRADIKMIGTDPCIILQEQHSQYIMVICGVSSNDFVHFPQLLQDRFWREAAALCKQANLYDAATLTRHLTALSDEQHYQLDPEPIEEGKITKVMEKLERRFLYDHEPLPTDGKSAFSFSFQINTRQPKMAQLQGQSNPAENLGNYCLNLIEAAIEQERKANDPVISIADNIVTVNFRQR